MTRIHQYTDDQQKYLKDNIKGTPYKTMRIMFNDHFKTDLTLSQIKGYLGRNNLTNGNDAKFVQGEESWNKGMKGLQIGGVETQFKKGQKSHNYMPVGSERVNSEGYTDIKVADPNIWRTKHRLMWEKVNGNVPKGHVLIFGDGDKSNVVLENIILVSRSQLAILNRYSLIQNDSELTKVGINIADLQLKISQKLKEEQH